MIIALYCISGIYCFFVLFLALLAKRGGCIEKKSGIRGVFAGIGEYIFSKKGASFLYSGQVRMILKAMNPAKDINKIIRMYYAQKTGDILLLLSCLLLLVNAYAYSSENDSILSGGNNLLRGGYSEGGTEVSLIASYEGEEVSRQIDYELLPRTYPYEDVSKMADDLLGRIEDMILAGNSDIDNISQDLYLPEKVQGYPFGLYWESSSYSLVDDTGAVGNEKLKEPECVTLTVHLSYREDEWEKSFPVTVVPRVLSEEEVFLARAGEELRGIDESQQTLESMTLPDTLLGRKVSWSIKKDAVIFWLMPFAFLLSALLFFLKDRDLEKNMNKRRERIEESYPEFVSRFELLFGAGLSIRSIFARISAQGEKDSDLALELKVLTRDLGNGIPERQAIERFGQRLQSPIYIKFSGLLIGNLKKGNADLLKLLRKEAQEALRIRKNLAKKKGEEAGTKLLFPMMMMLGVVMAVIILPAFMSL